MSVEADTAALVADRGVETGEVVVDRGGAWPFTRVFTELVRQVGHDAPMTRVGISGQHTVGEEAPERWEAERLERIERAVAGIASGWYPPDGIETGECALCPYWTICPA
jgi:hypothetical protein